MTLLPTVQLLATPTASDHTRPGHATQGGANLRVQVASTAEWGRYEPAIRRWEAMTRPAPPPSEPKDDGEGARLSPRFVEWMMGLPDGWVTDVDISRSHQLKALGNGVVPQQAYVALTLLMERVRW